MDIHKLFRAPETTTETATAIAHLEAHGYVVQRIANGLMDVTVVDIDAGTEEAVPVPFPRYQVTPPDGPPHIAPAFAVRDLAATHGWQAPDGGNACG